MEFWMDCLLSYLRGASQEAVFRTGEAVSMAISVKSSSVIGHFLAVANGYFSFCVLLPSSPAP
jgi:hypothetical protein